MDLTPQDLVIQSVKRRGYREGWTNLQFLARNIVKLAEEFAEMADNITIDKKQTQGMSFRIWELGARARGVFDQGSFDRVEMKNIDRLMKEAVDCQVVLFNIADACEALAGEPFDICQEAVKKSQADEKRGVRK